jgi:outer membrane murein-binding lipoprotein Lpp
VPVVPPVYAPPPPPQPPPFDHAGFAAKLLEEAKTLTRREAEALLDVRLRKFAETQITHAGIDDIVEKRVRLVTSTIDSTLARQTAQVDKATETNRAIRADLSAQIEKLRDKVDQLREQTQKLEEAHGRAGTRLYRITQHLTAEFKALSALRVLADLVAATLRRDMLHTGSHKIPPSEDEKLLMREAEQAVEILHARRPPKLEG